MNYGIQEGKNTQKDIRSKNLHIWTNLHELHSHINSSPNQQNQGFGYITLTYFSFLSKKTPLDFLPSDVLIYIHSLRSLKNKRKKYRYSAKINSKPLNQSSESKLSIKGLKYLSLTTTTRLHRKMKVQRRIGEGRKEKRRRTDYSTWITCYRRGEIRRTSSDHVSFSRFSYFWLVLHDALNKTPMLFAWNHVWMTFNLSFVS